MADLEDDTPAVPQLNLGGVRPATAAAPSAEDSSLFGRLQAQVQYGMETARQRQAAVEADVSAWKEDTYRRSMENLEYGSSLASSLWRRANDLGRSANMARRSAI